MGLVSNTLMKHYIERVINTTLSHCSVIRPLWHVIRPNNCGKDMKRYLTEMNKGCPSKNSFVSLVFYAIIYRPFYEEVQIITHLHKIIKKSNFKVL